MPDPGAADTNARLGRIEDRQADMQATLARVEEHMATMNGTLLNVNAEVGGAPESNAREGRDTLRARVHVLENDKAASRAAAAALDAAHRVRAGVWSRRQKIAIFAFAAAGPIGLILRLLGVGG